MCEETTAYLIGDESIAASVIRVDSVTLMMGRFIPHYVTLYPRIPVTIIINPMKQSVPASRDL